MTRYMCNPQLSSSEAARPGELPKCTEDGEMAFESEGGIYWLGSDGCWYVERGDGQMVPADE